MRPSSPHPQLHPDRGCVVSYCPIASAIGSRVLHEGGNAVDAAVATALALAVTYPQAGNLGGGGFLLYRSPTREVTLLDFRETAPRRAQPEIFLRADDGVGDRTVVGALSVGTPGAVAGLAEALARHGTWAWDRVLGLCIELCEHGVWLTTRQAMYFELHEIALRRFPSTRAAYLPGGSAPLPGTLFVQRQLGATLRALAHDGPDAFYRGAVADQIVGEIERGGGVLDGQDLGEYRPVWRTPLCWPFEGMKLYGAPPPSAGGLVLRTALALASAEELTRATAPRSLERVDGLARIFRVAFALRNQLAGDPDRFTADDHARFASWFERDFVAGDLVELERQVASERSTIADLASGRANTTHLCVLDRQGGAVSMTVSLNTMFGSKLVVDGAGFLLNNSIDDFRIAPHIPNWYDLVQGEHNQIAAGRRPVSSMSPTLLCSDERVELVLGGSGGPRIATAEAQTLLGLFGDGAVLQEAIRAPRVHHQYAPDELVLERAWPSALEAQLRAHGYANICRAPNLAILAAIARTPDDGISAALDGRFSFE